MDISAAQAGPDLGPETLGLLADVPIRPLPSRSRQLLLMEQALVTLDRFQPILEVRLGQVLAPLMRGAYKHLGYVTPAMFCREELGISATAAWDSVRLAEGLLGRPLLRQAFLKGGLPRTHALELLRLDAQEDAAWATRGLGLSVQELRQVVRPLRSSPAGREERESIRVRIYDLEVEPYATWLAAVELARRHEGRDLGPTSVLEQILAESLAARPLGSEKEGGEVDDPEQTCESSAPPPFQRDPHWTPAVSDASSTEAGSVEGEASSTKSASANAGTIDPAPELPRLLCEELPRSPRKLTHLARRLLGSRELVELQRCRILRRVQEGRLYREAGHRSFRAWLSSRGIAPSTAFQATARDQQLERHGLLRQALCEGRLAPTKVDLLLRLPRRADEGSWAAYAEGHTCRRLEEAVEAALVLANRFPSTWGHRRGSAPGDDETLAEFRQQAGLAGFEATFDDLAQAFQQAEARQTTPTEVQTSAAPQPASEAGEAAIRANLRANPVVEGVPAENALTESTSSPNAPTPEEEEGPTIRLRLFLPESLDRLLQAAEAGLRRDAGQEMSPEECLYVLCLVFLRQGGCPEITRAQSRLRRQALERAGYRCEAPGCGCRTNLHVHHIMRRSQGGSDELANLSVVCAAHHLRHLHGGTMRVEGDDPATRIWEMGLQDGQAWRVYCDDRLVDGEALPGEPFEDAEEAGEAEDDWGAKPDPPAGDDRVCEATPEYRAEPEYWAGPPTPDPRAA